MGGWESSRDDPEVGASFPAEEQVGDVTSDVDHLS